MNNVVSLHCVSYEVIIEFLPFVDHPDMNSSLDSNTITDFTGELSFAGTNVTCFVVIVILGIVCLNLLIISISILICRLTNTNLIFFSKSYSSGEIGKEERLTLFKLYLADCTGRLLIL